MSRWSANCAVVRVCLATVGFVSTVAWASGNANGEPVFWDDGTGADNSWFSAENWNPDGEPSSTSDVTLGVFVESDIEAQGFWSFNPITGRWEFLDPALDANSLTISTANSFTLNGVSQHPQGGVRATSLRLWSGDLTRQDVAGVEGDHFLDVAARLPTDGVWDVRGAGILSVLSISEDVGPRNFTKTGAGTLSATLSITGATNINQGVFRGIVDGTNAMTIASGGAWQVISDSIPFPAPVTLHGYADIPFFASLQKVEAGNAELSGPVTIENNPKISIGAGGKLTLSGGITSVNNSGFALLGTGELVLSGPGAGSILASILGGQLTIAHPGALGTGAVYAQDVSAGAFIPVLAIADGLTFANPITLRRGTIRALGNSTVSSNVTLSGGIVATYSNLDVPQASHTLTITGDITEDIAGSSLTKIGLGAVVLSGANSFSGGLTVAEGALANNGSITQSTTQVMANAVLAGSGQFADVNIMDSGRLAPGASANSSDFSPAAVQVEDIVFASPTTSLLTQLGGVTPGSEHDQVLVSGNATLAGNLNVSLANGFSLATNQTFLVLDVAGTLSGQFAGLGEGALVGNFGGEDLFITYAGGDGNDIVLFTSAAGVPGDYNGNGTVDAADYVVWRKTDGSQAGYDTWRANFGATIGSGAGESHPANAAIPEPTSLLLVFLAAAFGLPRRPRRRVSPKLASAPTPCFWPPLLLAYLYVGIVFHPRLHG